MAVILPIVKRIDFGILTDMDRVSDQFAEMVRLHIDAQPKPVSALESSLSLPEDTLRNLLRGGPKKAGPTLSKAKQICDAFGWELYFGPPRETGPVQTVILDGDDYAHIPLHDAMLAAGAGAQNPDESIIDHLAIRTDLLRRIGIAASAARLARVHGDSMEPTMWDGDMVMINTASPAPQPRARAAEDKRRAPIFALIDNGEARVKRIERPSADQMLLISDNPDYLPELRQGKDIDSIQIIGKVVWWGHTVRD